MRIIVIRFNPASLAALVGLVLFVVAGPAASTQPHDNPRICSATASLQLRACYAETTDDYFTAKAFCLNDPSEADDCVLEARAEKRAAIGECGAQHRARKSLCREIGEGAYAPDMDPDDFQDPRNPSRTNDYFPLVVGNHWVYEEDGEKIDIEIQDATKRIEGLDCIIYRDIVTEDERLVEATDDWFALRTNGDVVYCGEEVKDYEFFEGDDPSTPELTSIDGRFKAGVDLAKSGIAFLGLPVVGMAYRQEWDPGNAEDVGKVLSTNYRYGDDEELDEFVPKALAEHMCGAGGCVVIRDTSTLDPDAFERKYYAKGVGKFLEVKPDEGEFVPLVECNVDPKCDVLPLDEADEED